ncbi:MAG TPA: hypothetical protein VF600_15100 [Abditibacteriaceae bacterium]
MAAKARVQNPERERRAKPSARRSRSGFWKSFPCVSVATTSTRHA